MVVDGIEYCDKCESVIPNFWYQDRCLTLQLGGGYGMFMDLIYVELIFCHTCAVNLFRSIPQLSADKLNGLHSVPHNHEDGELCCEYCFTFGELDGNNHHEVILGTKEDFDKRKETK